MTQLIVSFPRTLLNRRGFTLAELLSLVLLTGLILGMAIPSVEKTDISKPFVMTKAHRKSYPYFDVGPNDDSDQAWQSTAMLAHQANGMALYQGKVSSRD